MRHDLNSAVRDIGLALGYEIGIRRTYGGGDDSNRMHIVWQLLDHGQPIGLITLVCEDGMGKDGLLWHGVARITAPNIYHTHGLVTPWDKLSGRRAKRITRQKFFNSVDNIIKQVAPHYDRCGAGIRNSIKADNKATQRVGGVLHR